MNKENFLKLADTIENPGIEGLGFNMEYEYSHDGYDVSGRGCGTVACIMGWAAHLKDPSITTEWYYRQVEKEAAEYLGIGSIYKCESLFYPPMELDWEKLTPQHAANTIRHLIATGYVDWYAANPELGGERFVDGEKFVD